MGKKPTSGMAKVNGTSIYYEVNGNGFPVVLVSGGGILDRRGWDEQFQILAKYFLVVRYDVRGIGKSLRPTREFSHSEDLYALLKFLKFSRAHLIGLSVGGAIAIDFTLEHPNKVDHLVLAASGLSDDAKADANIQSLAMLKALTRKEGIEHVIQLTLDAPFVITKENEAARQKIRMIYLDNRDVFESGFPLYMFWQPTRPRASERLSKILVPTLIIRGDRDNPAYITLTDKISRGIKNSRTKIISGGTHFIHLDKPQEFNRAVMEFLVSCF
jgi:pimeloyl-ACP methyl ester carboxylesterase